MVTIENEKLKAVISPKGAELQSLFNKETGIEYMWGGDAAYWSKHSPILFPIVGTLKNDTYFYKDEVYHLPRHGFARERIFLKDQVSLEEAVFTLTQDADTLAVYPFAFILRIRYHLQDDQLKVAYEVSNNGYDELLFSVGAHPAFAVPMVDGTDYADYYLQFNTTEALHRWKLQDGLIANHAEPLPAENGKLALQHNLFYEDAIVLKNMQSNRITIGCTKHAHGIHFNFNDFPFFGIWAAKDADFVCLEPWCGIADGVDHNQQLKDKEGIINLAANTNWQRSWAVECF
ncbi:aldose 1-epimerase family protein [soil metagenome]